MLTAASWPGVSEAKDTNVQLNAVLKRSVFTLKVKSSLRVTSWIANTLKYNILSQYSVSGSTCLKLIYIVADYTVEKHIYIYDHWDATNSIQSTTENDYP